MKKINVYSIVMNNFKNDTRVLKEALSLKKADYNVKIIALHDGTNDLEEFDTVQGIDVHRIKLITKNYSNNIVVQMIKYIEFTLKVLINYRKVDIIHCNDLDPLPIAALLKLLSFGKIKIVYDAHELETEKNGLWGVRKKLVKITEWIFIHFVDTVVTVSEGIAAHYSNKYHIVKPKIVLNCPQYRDYEKHNFFRERFQIRDNQLIFLYQGGLSKGRGIEILLKAFEKVEKQDIALIFMGYGELSEYIKEISSIDNRIFYHEAVAPDILFQYTASADIGICLIENSCLSYYYCLPNKLFEYSMAGLPTIISNLPEMTKLIGKYQCGVIIEDYNQDKLSEVISNCSRLDLKSMSENARKMAQTYCWAEQEKVLLEVYKELVHFRY